MLHFFQNGSTTIFHFLLSKVFETYQVYYTVLFIAFEFIFTVSLKHIFCLPKKPEWLFFSWLDYKSLLNKFSVLINYSVLCGLPIIFPHPAVSLVFHGPGFSGSRVWVQVLEVANLHSENYTYIAFLKKQCYLWKCYSSLHTFNNNMEIRKVTTFCKLLKENTWKCM